MVAGNELWGKILASVLNKPLTYRKGGEVGPAFGAARLAKVGVSELKNNTKKFNFKSKKTLGTKEGIQKLDDNFIVQSLFSDHTVANAVLSSPTDDIQLQVF